MTQETSSSQKTRVCPTCGTRLSENATRCLVCGTELTAKAELKSKKAEIRASRMPEITLSLPAALGALVIILLIGAAGVYFALGSGLTGASLVTPTAVGTATATPT
ncbi:MAG: zinc-ribbon domain-containing protein, partial [Chloroflexota bacterium]